MPETLRLVRGLRATPRRALDIGCGTGALLRAMAQEFPAAELAGVDAAGGMVRTARQAGMPAALAQASAAALPFGSQVFDLVTSTVSFHQWGDQRAGLAEVGRVPAPGGVFVLADLQAVGYLRVIYALGRRCGRVHAKRELAGMLGEAGLRVSDWAPTAADHQHHVSFGRHPLRPPHRLGSKSRRSRSGQRLRLSQVSCKLPERP